MESLFLAYLTARLDILCRCDHTETLVGINRTENHTLALDAHHLARSEVSNKEDAFADKLFWILIESSDT